LISTDALSANRGGAAVGGSLALHHQGSNSLRGTPDCRIMACSVPMRSSLVIRDGDGYRTPRHDFLHDDLASAPSNLDEAVPLHNRANFFP
jgi:hypothetical protein